MEPPTSETIEQAKQRDETALLSLSRYLVPRIERLVDQHLASSLRDPAYGTEEATNDTLLYLLDSLSAYREEFSFDEWSDALVTQRLRRIALELNLVKK